MSIKRTLSEFRRRVEQLEEACRIQTDTLVCALLIIGEFAQMTRGFFDRDSCDLDLFEEAKDRLEENMGWLEDNGFTDGRFPNRSARATERRPFHLKLVVDNKECTKEEEKPR